MLINPNPLLKKDVYKTGHPLQYPSNTEYIYSNHTARKSRVPGVNHVTYFGINNYLEVLVREWKPFFEDSKLAAQYIQEYKTICKNILGYSVDTTHLEALQKYGRLPLTVNCVPEGTKVPIGVPMMTMKNTHPCGFFLPQSIETDMSSRIWMALTSATTAVIRRQKDNIAVKQSGGPKEFLPYLCHGFEYRGMGGLEAAIMSGLGQLIAFNGHDTIPAMVRLQEVYTNTGWIGNSIAATEHSVMCVNGENLEFETIERILSLYPDVAVSIVSDTWNIWRVIDNYLPRLGTKLTNRTAPLVIRPDSGEPVNILMGDKKSPEGIVREGVVNALMSRFGHRVTPKGYKLLPQYLGTVYGDAMNDERCDSLNTRMLEQRVCPTCTVRGIGSYQHQMVTRDTYGQAIKGTEATVNGEVREMFKDPITSDGEKRSLRGKVGVVYDTEGNIIGCRDRLQPNDDTGYTYQPLVDGILQLNTNFNHVRQVTKVW